jgi:hypothetical protein
MADLIGTVRGLATELSPSEKEKKAAGYAFRLERRNRRQKPSSGTQLTSYKNSRSSYLWVSSSHTDRLSVSKCWSVPTGAVETGNGLACGSLVRMAKVKSVESGAALRCRKVAYQISVSQAIQFPTSPPVLPVD